MTYISDEYSPAIIDESTITTTHSSAQGVSTTRAIITGSEIQYTPTSSSTHVLYQCTFQWTNRPDVNTHLYISLMEKSNVNDPWSYVTNKSFAISFLDSSQACSFENVEILIPTWSGSKYLGLYIRSSSSSTEGTLHQLKMGDSSFGTGSESYVSTFVSATSLRSYA